MEKERKLIINVNSSHRPQNDAVTYYCSLFHKKIKTLNILFYFGEKKHWNCFLILLIYYSAIDFDVSIMIKKYYLFIISDEL